MIEKGPGACSRRAGGQKDEVVGVGLAENGLNDAAVDAQRAAELGGAPQDGAGALADDGVVGRRRCLQERMFEE